jgi:hypothetical protein
MPIKHPTLTERENDEVNDLREKISNFVNRNSIDAIVSLGRLMANDHRTLVQSKGHLVLGFLEELQRHHKEGHTDARNEAIAKWADEALTKTDGIFLPYI